MNRRSTCRANRTLIGAATILLILAVQTSPVGAHFLTERVSVSSGGRPGNDFSGFEFSSAISADGRFVAFLSHATNLVPGDTNFAGDVFVRDRVRGVTRRVSVSSGGGQSNGDCANLALSAGGRFVTFLSFATNLVPGDSNGRGDIFIRDRKTGTTDRVNVSSGGGESDGDSFYSAPSAGGRFVVFDSDATNLVPGDTNGRADVFVRDRVRGVTQRVSVSSGGGQGDSGSSGRAISADGRLVAFTSEAANLVPGDTNGVADVFIHDRLAHTTERVSVSSGGGQSDGPTDFNPTISANGRFVAFESAATNLVPGDTNGVVDVFVRDRTTGKTQRVSVSSGGRQGNRDSFSFSPAISADGRFVAFESEATNLVPGDTNGVSDVIVRDRATGTTRRVSRATDGRQGNMGSFGSAMSADGRFVAFNSEATNLVPGDTNGVVDVFVRVPFD